MRSPDKVFCNKPGIVQDCAAQHGAAEKLSIVRTPMWVFSGLQTRGPHDVSVPGATSKKLRREAPNPAARANC